MTIVYVENFKYILKGALFMPYSLFNISGKTALITGSSRGIGFALAQGLGQAGARLVINGTVKILWKLLFPD